MANYRNLRLCIAFLLGLLVLLNGVQATPVQNQDLADTKTVQARNFDNVLSTLEARRPKCRKTKTVTCKKRSVEFFDKRATLAQLWGQLSTADTVSTGATKQFRLDPSKGGLWGTSELSGCTAVVLVNGKNILIGHYCQEIPEVRSVIDDRKATESDIVRKLEAVLPQFEESDDTQSWIVHSSRNSNPVGLPLIKRSITEYDCCKESLIATSRYTAGSGGTNNNYPNGKFLVQLIPNSLGGFELKVYIQNDTPAFHKKYDAQGNPCKDER